MTNDIETDSILNRKSHSRLITIRLDERDPDENRLIKIYDGAISGRKNGLMRGFLIRGFLTEEQIESRRLKYVPVDNSLFPIGLDKSDNLESASNVIENNYEIPEAEQKSENLETPTPTFNFFGNQED